jgi:hypothetical protein
MNRIRLAQSFSKSINLRRSMSSSLPPLKAAPRVEGKSFRIGLIQLGGTTPDKATNLARAKMMIERAASAIPKVDMIVLPVRSFLASSSCRQFLT